MSLAQRLAAFLNPLGHLLGLDGAILLAYVIAIPANEIVVPTLLMIYMGTGMMTELPSLNMLKELLVQQHGWTLLTAINLMLFSLLHNPCATTILTIYKETGSKKWATWSVIVTLGSAFVVTFLVATLARTIFRQ
jgi:ferrous iron transport protein B